MADKENNPLASTRRTRGLKRKASADALERLDQCLRPDHQPRGNAALGGTSRSKALKKQSLQQIAGDSTAPAAESPSPSSLPCGRPAQRFLDLLSPVASSWAEGLSPDARRMLELYLFCHYLSEGQGVLMASQTRHSNPANTDYQ